MKALPLRISLILLMAFTFIPHFSLSATDDQWIRISDEYQTYLESLPGYTQWIFNTARGPNDRWVINFTISGFGFHPTTFLICDESQYHQWLQTGSPSNSHFYQAVNYSLHTTVDLPYPSQWYCVLNNTGPVTLYFSIHLIYYRRTEFTTPLTTIPLNGISNLFVYLIILGIIVLIIFPCLCRISCCGYYRRTPKSKAQSKEPDSQPIIVVLTPEQPPRYFDDEEDP